MPLAVRWKISLTAIAFLVGSGGAYWLLDVGVWPMLLVGSLFAATTLGALILAAVAARAGGTLFSAFWTPGTVTLCNCTVGATLILLGSVLGAVEGSRRLTAVAIICVAGGLVMIGISLIGYSRIRRNLNRG